MVLIMAFDPFSVYQMGALQSCTLSFFLEKIPCWRTYRLLQMHLSFGFIISDWPRLSLLICLLSKVWFQNQALHSPHTKRPPFWVVLLKLPLSWLKVRISTDFPSFIKCWQLTPDKFSYHLCSPNLNNLCSIPACPDNIQGPTPCFGRWRYFLPFLYLSQLLGSLISIWDYRRKIMICFSHPLLRIKSCVGWSEMSK